MKTKKNSESITAARTRRRAQGTKKSSPEPAPRTAPKSTAAGTKARESGAGDRPAHKADVKAFGNVWLRMSQSESPGGSSAVLTNELRELLSRLGGARPQNPSFRLNGVDVGVGRLLTLGKVRAVPSVGEAMDDIDAAGDSALGLLPFAIDTGNADYFCVERATGRVFYWRRDSAPRSLPVANDLDAFLTNLVP